MALINVVYIPDPSCSGVSKITISVITFCNIDMVLMSHYQKMEQSLSLMVFSQARCPRFAFFMYNISFRGALLEPHAISCFRVRYLQKRDARSAILSIFTVSQGQGK